MEGSYTKRFDAFLVFDSVFPHCCVRIVNDWSCRGGQNTMSSIEPRFVVVLSNSHVLGMSNREVWGQFKRHRRYNVLEFPCS